MSSHAAATTFGFVLLHTCYILCVDTNMQCTQEEPREAQLPPQERVQAVRPFWETLTQEQRVQLLSLSIDELRAKAAEVTARLRRQTGVLLDNAGYSAPCLRDLGFSFWCFGSFWERGTQQEMGSAFGMAVSLSAYALCLMDG